MRFLIIKKELLWFVLSIVFITLFFIFNKGFFLLLSYIAVIIPFRKKIKDRI